MNGWETCRAAMNLAAAELWAAAPSVWPVVVLTVAALILGLVVGKVWR